MRIAFGFTSRRNCCFSIFLTKLKIVLENEGLLILFFYLVLAFHDFEIQRLEFSYSVSRVPQRMAVSFTGLDKEGRNQTKDNMTSF